MRGNADGSPSSWYFIADLYAESREAFDKILASPEGEAAVADLANFATGGATFIYTEVEDLI